jgi:hypothetical protein
MDYIAPSDFFQDIYGDWHQYQHSNPAQTFRALLEHSIALPDPSIQIPLITAFAVSNPKFSLCLPALFIYGREGTGKSTLGTLLSHFRDAEIFNEKSTMASIRNYINYSKYIPETDEQQERDGALLFLDNVYQRTFYGTDLAQIFLGGYKRSSDQITIASPGTGSNIRFRTFCNRVYTSVDPLHTCYSLRELTRRSCLVYCERLERIQGCEFNLETAIDVDNINWEGFYWHYAGWWQSADNLIELKACYHGLKRRPSKIPSDRWEHLKDLAAIGIVLGIWADKSTMSAYFRDYLDWLESQLSLKSALEQLIESAIPQDCPLIPNSFLKKKKQEWLDSGTLLDNPRRDEIPDCMLRLGYTATKDGWKKA